MKKIYLSIATLALFVGATAQNATKAPTPHTQKAMLDPNAKIPAKVKALAKPQGGTFKIQIDPIEEIMTQKGLDLTSGNPQEDTFLGSVWMDSTVSIATSTGALRVNNDILMGSTFDPKSTFLQSSFQPIVTPTDSYNLDSVFIQGSYIKKTGNIDTLYVWAVWGDSTNTNVFTKFSNASVWVSPIATWRKSVIGPKITGATGAAGNKVKAAAPATNMKLVKYVLQPIDSTARGYGFSKFISIPFTSPTATAGITIPGGNIVSVFYTFVPGGTHTLNQPMYSFTTAIVPTINGYCAIVWNQNSPAVTAVADYRDYQVDAASWNMGMSYDKKQRHGIYSATYQNAAIGELTSAPRMVYSITGNSSVGIKEIANKGFALGQNNPNPFTGESSVSYTIDKEASSATFSVTDVMGRVVSSQKAEASKGTHTINLGSYAAGVYYYSLNVDGKVTTKKMIAQ